MFTYHFGLYASRFVETPSAGSDVASIEKLVDIDKLQVEK